MGHRSVLAADLLLGAACPGCGCPAMAVCRRCGESMSPRPRAAWPRPTPLVLREPVPVRPVAAGVNAGVLRASLLAWKEEGRFGLSAVMEHLLAAAAGTVASNGPIVLVPVPTSRRSRRARGVDLVDGLARGAARLLQEVGVDVTVSQALRYSRRTVDQAGLGAAQRAANVRGAFRLRTDSGLRGRDAVVVDDILTTGATVAEAVRVLDAAGHRPIGIAVVAATERDRK